MGSVCSVHVRIALGATPMSPLTSPAAPTTPMVEAADAAAPQLCNQLLAKACERLARPLSAGAANATGGCALGEPLEKSTSASEFAEQVGALDRPIVVAFERPSALLPDVNVQQACAGCSIS